MVDSLEAVQVQPRVEAAAGLLRGHNAVCSGITQGLPTGDGHAVMFLPGFAMGEDALRTLAAAIRQLGYDVYGWGQGRNFGLSLRVLGAVVTRTEQIVRQHKSAISLVGWSAGGLYAREVARRHPALVRHVFAIGTPIRSDRHAPLVQRWVGHFDRLRAVIGDCGFAPDAALPRVPTTAIYSRTDAIVPWPTALEFEGACTENVEVDGGHFALGNSAQVLAIVARRLARSAPTDATRRPA